ncbi:MAG: CPBP family intramembrane glutamic endopeptidase [Vicinamibacterales bacterium]
MDESASASSHVPRGRLGHLLLRSKAARIGEIIAVFGVPVVLIGASQLMAGENPGLQQLVVLFAILIMVALVYVGVFLRGQRWDHFGLTFRGGSARGVVRTVLQSLVAFVAAAGLFLAAAVGFSWVAGAAEAAEATGLEFLQGDLSMLLVTLLVVYVTASFSEEVIYRGFLMNRIVELGGGGRTSWIVALALSSITFGLAHYSWGPAGMVQSGFMGLGLGTVYLLFGRKLWVVILAHGYMDTVLLVQAYLSADPGATF